MTEDEEVQQILQDLIDAKPLDQILRNFLTLVEKRYETVDYFPSEIKWGVAIQGLRAVVGSMNVVDRVFEY